MSRTKEALERYYNKTAHLRRPVGQSAGFTLQEDTLILGHVMPDMQLARIIKRDLRAIQKRRSFLHAKLGSAFDYTRTHRNQRGMFVPNRIHGAA